MSFDPGQLIDALGGTTAVANMIKTPPSTVHSWRTIGLTQGRLDHLRLAAHANALGAAFDAIVGGDEAAEVVAVHASTDTRAEARDHV